MGINRITSNFLSQQSVNYLHNNLQSVSALQQKISSGQNINRASDDPVGLTRILSLSNTLSVDSRYGRNIQSAVSEANTADTVMSNMVDLVQRAQELSTQAASVTNNQDGRNAIALEIDQIINQMVQLGNTDIGGQYIFGGMKTDSPPFARTGDTVTYTGTPNTQSWQRELEIARGVTVSVNTNEQDLLGQADVTSAGPPVTFAAGASGIFKTLLTLKNNLTNSTDPNQLTEIRTRLDELTTDMNTIVGQQSVVGSVSNRLDLSQNRIDQRKSILTQQYASIQDIDAPSAIANLNSQQNILDASLNITARVLQTSLLSYL
jgi:flagellar hook-associated protein 3 FlgL